jgi:hypothetical protein
MVVLLLWCRCIVLGSISGHGVSPIQKTMSFRPAVDKAIVTISAGG